MASEADAEKLSTLKTEVRCTLISTKEGLTVRDFLRDYKETVGKPFPFNSFGYKSPIDCLRSMPDVVQIVRSCGVSDLLMPVEDKKSAHINKLTREQKKSSKRGFSRPRPIQLPRDNLNMLVPAVPPLKMISPGPRRGWENRRLEPNYHPSVHNTTTEWFRRNETMNNGPTPLYNFSEQRLTTINHVPYFKPQFDYHLDINSYPSAPNSVKPVRLSLENGLSKDKEPHRNNQSSSSTVQNVTNSETRFEDDLCETLQEGMVVNQKDLVESGVSSNVSDDDGDCHDDDSGSLFSDKMKENFRAILSEHPNGIPTSKFPLAYQKKFGVPLNQNDLGFQTIKELVLCCSDVFKIYKSKKQKQDWLLFETSSNVISNEDSRKWIPNQILENMQELAANYPSGITSEDILAAYKKQFMVPLDYKRLGFQNLTSFLVHCQSIECKIDDDSFVVFPVNWGKKDPFSYELNENAYENFLPPDKEDFLWKEHFSELVCDPNFRYEKFILPETEGSGMKAYVCDALSPDVFWIQNAETGHVLADMMYELNIFYDQEEEKFTMNDKMIFINLACCVKYSEDKRWHRVLINPPIENDEVKVVYVDYGTSGFVKTKDLRTLHKKFGNLPVQAVKSKLYGIKPINEHGWEKESLTFFFNMCVQNVLFAEIIKVQPEVPLVEVVLWDTKGVEDIIVNNEMINNNFAVPVDNIVTSLNSKSMPEKNLSVEVSSSGKHPTDFEKEHYPHCFLKLLPPWIGITDEWTVAADILEQASSMFASSRHNKSPTIPPSCCSHHLLSHLFVNNPKDICDIWEKVINAHYRDIERKFLQNICSQLKVNFDLKSDKRLCKIGSESSIDDPGKNQIKVKSNTDKKLISDSHKTRIREKENNNDIPEHQDMSGKTGLSIRSSTEEAIIDVCSDPVPHNMTSRHPGAITRHVLKAKIGTNIIHIVNHEKEVYVVMDELLNTFAKSIPYALVTHRLIGRRFNISPVTISQNDNLAYSELVINRVINGSEKTVTLVPLLMAGEFLTTVDPLQAVVSHMLKNLARDCTINYEGWYE